MNKIQSLKNQIRNLEVALDACREQLAEEYIKQSGKAFHSSSCATSAAPAYTPGECDCGC